MSRMDSFQERWEGQEELYEYDSDSSDSSYCSTSSTGSSRGYDNPSHNRTKYSYRPFSPNSYQPPSLTEFHQRRQSDSYDPYDLEYDSSSSSSSASSPSSSSSTESDSYLEHSPLSTTLDNYLSTKPHPETPAELQTAILDINNILQQKLNGNEDSSSYENSTRQIYGELPLSTESEICTTILYNHSSDPKLTQLCEKHLLFLACSHGSIMSSGTTDSHFEVLLEDEGGNQVFGWELYAPTSALLRVSDVLEDGVKSESNTLPEYHAEMGEGESIQTCVRNKEVFLNEILRLPADVLLSVERVRGLLRPVQGK
ncbi:hypothetical protein HYALB_00001541 [Hymenoscyphus albidus]|uniref:Uncharacterized protein n=1 Tax=Hymenoscyphus albidus TaxID=595503 RepID=A0A9N9Q297_9HELO|nr:hypothetical protein HYALB_00001541 [Hymenoscyphus albidus]